MVEEEIQVSLGTKSIEERVSDGVSGNRKKLNLISESGRDLERRGG